MRGGGFANSRASGRGGMVGAAGDSDTTQSNPPPPAKNNWGSNERTDSSVADSPRKETDFGTWDPMKEDYKQNSYVPRQSGGGQREQWSAVMVKEIPPSMDVDGVRNLFSEKIPSLTPRRVKVLPPREGFRNLIGFVDYGSISECEEVIRVMNGCPCGNNTLRVELGKNSRRSTDQPGGGRGGFRQQGENRETWGNKRDNTPPSRPSGNRDQSPRDSNSGTPTKPWGTTSTSPRKLPADWSTPAQTPASDWSAAVKPANSTTAQAPAWGQPAGKADPPAEPAKVCVNCEKQATMSCSAPSCTGRVFYCGSTCQMAHWPKHEDRCGAGKGLDQQQEAQTRPTPPVPTFSQVKPQIPQASEQPTLTLQSLPQVHVPDTCLCMYVFGPSPLDFTVQLTANEGAINDILNKMAVYGGRQLQANMGVNDGDLVAGLWNDDWYRAEVLLASSTTAKVRYIDFGNVEETHIRDIRKLDILQDVMPQGIQCRLHDILVENEHANDVMTYFQELVISGGPNLQLQRVKQRVNDLKNGIFEVNLTLPTGDNVADSLVAKGYAQRISAPRVAPVMSSITAPVTSSCYKSPEIELGVATDVTVAYVTNYNEIYVSVLNGYTRMVEISEKLDAYVASTRKAVEGSVSVGDGVVAEYEGLPYRGEVIGSLPSGQLKVKMVDYGNIEVYSASELWPVDSDVLVFPHLAVKCELDISGYELAVPAETVLNTLKQTYPDGNRSSCEFLRRTSDGYMMKLSRDDGTGELAALVSAGLLRRASSAAGPPSLASGGPPRLAASQPPALNGAPIVTSVSNLKRRVVTYSAPYITSLPVGTTLNTTVTSIANPTRIHANFLTRDTSTDFLKDLLRAGEGLPSFSLLHEKPERDELVLCFADDTQEWFRAYVMEVNETTCKVYALDYGSEDTVTLDRVVPALDKHNSVPPQAFHVTIQGAERMLTKLRDAVPRGDWEPILKDLLLKGEFQSKIISQSKLDVTIQPGFEFVGKLKERIRPIADRHIDRLSTASSTPPPAGSLNGLPSPAPPPGYTLIPTREYERQGQRLEQLERTVSELSRKIDVLLSR